jgi:hypothetical protein
MRGEEKTLPSTEQHTIVLDVDVPWPSNKKRNRIISFSCEHNRALYHT